MFHVKNMSEDTTAFDPASGRTLPLQTAADVSDLPRGVDILSIIVDAEKVIYGLGGDKRVYTWDTTYAIWKLYVHPTDFKPFVRAPSGELQPAPALDASDAKPL